MLSFLLKHWKKIAVILGVLLVLEIAYRLIQKDSPKSQATSSSIQQSTSVVSSEQASSSIRVEGRASTVGKESVERDDKITTSIVRERYRPDGTLESREFEKTERESKAQKTTTVTASKSTEIVLTGATQSALVASASVAASESIQTVFHDETPQAGIGPIIWVTTDGTFAGLSYRVFELKSAQINASAVLGTRINSLPDLDLGGGGFISKTMAPGLELGVVGVVKVPSLETQVGLGLSYQF